MEFKAFMAHIPKTDWKSTVEHLINRLPQRKYLIAGEHKPYEHLHFLVEMTDTEYRNYANLVFKQKHKLNGRAQKDGTPRQYGKLKQIRDLERLQAYMIKDSLEYNVNIFTNMSKDKLKLLKETISHKKLDKTPHKRFINYLKEEYTCTSQYTSFRTLCKLWLKVAQTRLPSLKGMMYYCYQSGIIDENTYISYHLDPTMSDTNGQIFISYDWIKRHEK